MTDLLLDSLATWRLVRLLYRDDITEPPRQALIEWTLEHDRRKLRTLIQCPHCLGIWCAGLVLALRRVPGGRIVRDLLAVAGAQSILWELEPKATTT